MSIYTPPEAEQPKRTDPRLPPYPKVGDTVRFYDLDGGDPEGEVKVGKITFIQPSAPSSPCPWQAEVTPLDNLGDGYFTDYPSRKRRSLRTLRPVTSLAPLVSSYVRSEDAFKIPLSSTTFLPLPSHPGYNLDGYTGPSTNLSTTSAQTLEDDGEAYSALKSRLIRDAALAGAAGTAIAGLTNGPEDAAIYACGAAAGVGYLLLLGVKTDTVGGATAKFGNALANLRFVLPAAVLIGVSLRNMVGGGLVGDGGGLFRYVTAEQFGAAMLGFLTYRIPLFVGQIAPVVGESAGGLLPGSAGVALDMVREAKEASDAVKAEAGTGKVFAGEEGLTTVLVVSGPAGTGKTGLVQRLIADGEGRFLEPKLVDKVADPAVFDRLQNRGDILEVGGEGRYGLTKDGILTAVGDNNGGGNTPKPVVVVDANVELTKKLTQIGGARIVGVWVGLDSLDKFEARIKTEIDAGRITVPDDETEETMIRTKIRDIVSDIEYGLVSGVFEFTILNDDFEKSLEQLKDAAAYCFK